MKTVPKVMRRRKPPTRVLVLAKMARFKALERALLTMDDDRRDVAASHREPKPGRVVARW